jgi:hypothetical protein
MTTYTANNQRIQFFINCSTKYPANEIKEAKLQRLKKLEGDLRQQNVFMNELFPSKQFLVLEQIIYWINKNNGICKFGTDKLIQSIQDNIGVSVSVRTVRSAIKAIKMTRQFIVTRLQSNRCNNGKYVIVDMKHDSFKEILKEVFLLSDDKIAHQFAHQKPEKNNDEALIHKQSIDENKSFNLTIFKTSNTNNNIYKAIQQDIEEDVLKNNNREYVAKFATNDYQLKFYDLVDMLPLPQQIMEHKAVIALRIGSDATSKTFVKAKRLIMHMAVQIKDGYTYDNVVAAFTKGLYNAMQYKPVKTATAPKEVPVFAHYNWLKTSN